MKRILICIMMAFCSIAMVAAHGNARGGRSYGGPPRQKPGYSRSIPRPAAESVSISGNLTIVQGMIAVQSDGTTYFVRGLNRFVGFVDGLREGAEVTLEGSAFFVQRGDSARFLQVDKMTLGGREYDLARPRQNVRPRSMPPPSPQRMRRGR